MKRLLFTAIVMLIASYCLAQAVMYFLLGFLNTLAIEPLKFEASLEITFDGYEHDEREIFEIEEVKSYYADIYKQFPSLLFFLSCEMYGEFQSAFQLFFTMAAYESKAYAGSGIFAYTCNSQISAFIMGQSYMSVRHMLKEQEVPEIHRDSTMKRLLLEYDKLVDSF
jgi:hypothetical protein